MKSSAEESRPLVQFGRLRPHGPDDTLDVVDSFDSPRTGADRVGDIRKAEFQDLMRRPLTIVALIFGAILGGLVGRAVAQSLGSGFIVIGVVVIPSFIMLVVFVVASEKASRAFFVRWAELRGLVRYSESPGPVVPLLGRGYRQKIDEAFSGKLESGLEGVICLFTYFTSAGADEHSESEHPFTVVLTEVEDTRGWLPELLVWKKSGPRIFEKLEDAFRRDHRRVQPSSDEMAKRYEVFVRTDTDELRVAELFSPAFVSWLTTTPPKGFAFELVKGWLCVYLPKYRTTTEELDGLVSCSREVVERLRQESPA